MDLPGATKLDFVHITNVEVSEFQQSGILIGAFPADGSKSGWTNIQLTGCVAHDNGGAGISSYGYFSDSATTYAHANIVVRDGTVYSNRGIQNKGSNSGNGIAADQHGPRPFRAFRRVTRQARLFRQPAAASRRL